MRWYTNVWALFSLIPFVAKLCTWSCNWLLTGVLVVGAWNWYYPVPIPCSEWIPEPIPIQKTIPILGPIHVPTSLPESNSIPIAELIMKQILEPTLIQFNQNLFRSQNRFCKQNSASESVLASESETALELKSGVFERKYTVFWFCFLGGSWVFGGYWYNFPIDFPITSYIFFDIFKADTSCRTAY